MAQNIEILIRAVDRATPAIRSTETALRGLGKTSSFVGETLKFFAQAQVFGGLMALQAGLVGSVAAGVKFNSSMELARMRWTELTGSASQGEGMVQMILRVAKETSFTTDQINNYATMLAGAGVKSKDLEGKLMGLANVTAKYGLTNEQAQAAIRGYTQAIGKGKTSVEELNQMQENGIPIYQILRDELGLTSAEIQGAGKDAKTSALIIDFLNNKFLQGTGAIEAYGRTFAGRLDKMKDTFTVFAGVLTKPIFDTLKRGMTDVTNYMDRVMAKMQEGQSAIQALASAMSNPAWRNFATVMGVIAGLAAWGVLSRAIPMIMRLVTAVRNGGTAFTLLKGAISPVGAIVVALATTVGLLVKSFLNAYRESAELKLQMGQLKAIFGIVKTSMSDFGSAIVDIITGMTNGESATQRWEAVMKLLVSTAGNVAIALGYFADGIIVVVRTIQSVYYAVKQAVLVFKAFEAAAQGNFGKAGEYMKQAGKAGTDSINSMKAVANSFNPETSIGAKTERAMARLKSSATSAETSFSQSMLGMKNNMAQTGASMSATASASGTAISNGIKKGSVGAQVLQTRIGAAGSVVNAKIDAMSGRATTGGVKISSGLQKGSEGSRLLQARIAENSNNVNRYMSTMGIKASDTGTKVSGGLKKGSAGADALKTSVSNSATGIAGSSASIIKSASSAGKGMTSSGKSGGNGFRVGITSGSKSAEKAVSSAVVGMSNNANKGATNLTSAGKTGGTGMANGIKSGSSPIPGIVKGVMDRAKAAITNISWSSAGSALMKTFASGVSSGGSWVTTAVQSVVRAARALLPGSDAKEGPLSDLTHSGYMLPVTFAKGLAQGTGSVVAQANRMVAEVDRSLQSEVGARMFASGNSVTVYHRHDGTVNVNGSGVSQADQFVSGSIGYEIGTDGVKQAIRSRTGGR
jgi:tape measure domain-containing protein